MNPSREVAMETLRRGGVLDIDLDWFRERDTGECHCAACIAIRDAIAEGHRGTARLSLSGDVDPTDLR